MVTETHGPPARFLLGERFGNQKHDNVWSLWPNTKPALERVVLESPNICFRLKTKHIETAQAKPTLPSELECLFLKLALQFLVKEVASRKPPMP